MLNPIFIEYYPHEKCLCYKILNPWTEYREEKIVLCPTENGLDKAKTIAIGILNEILQEALQETPTLQPDPY